MGLLGQKVAEGVVFITPDPKIRVVAQKQLIFHLSAVTLV